MQIGNKKLSFVLDTGATHTIIDTKLAKEFKLILDDKIDILDALNSNFKIDSIKPIKLKIGNHNILTSILLSSDFSTISKVFEEDIQGVIGLDIIRRFIWHIDIKNHQITLSTNPRIMANQQCTNLRDDGYSLIIKTIYNNKRKDFINFKLDTGASSNQISKEVADYLRNNKSVIENPLNKENPNIVTTIKQQVDVNDTISYIHDINLPIIDKDKEYLAPIILEDIDVVKDDLYFLGQNFIEQFSEVVINPYDMQFCFVKDKNKKELKLLRQIYNKADNNNQILIDDNNPKYLSKLLLKNKDIIISINDKEYKADDITQVRHMLRYEPNLNLVIKRDNKLINVKLD